MAGRGCAREVRARAARGKASLTLSQRRMAPDHHAQEDLLTASNLGQLCRAKSWHIGGRRDVGVCGSGWLLGAVRVLWSRAMVWSLWARSVSLVRLALGGGSDCRGPMVVRREKKHHPLCSVTDRPKFVCSVSRSPSDVTLQTRDAGTLTNQGNNSMKLQASLCPTSADLHTSCACTSRMYCRPTSSRRVRFWYVCFTVCVRAQANHECRDAW